MFRIASIPAVLALAMSAPAAAEVVATSDNGFVTKDEVTIAATPRQVWLALIKPGEW